MTAVIVSACAGGVWRTLLGQSRGGWLNYSSLVTLIFTGRRQAAGLLLLLLLHCRVLVSIMNTKGHLPWTWRPRRGWARSASSTDHYRSSLFVNSNK